MIGLRIVRQIRIGRHGVVLDAAAVIEPLFVVARFAACPHTPASGSRPRCPSHRRSLSPPESLIDLGAEDPGAGLLDRQDIVPGDLELDLHGERFTGCRVVQTLEVVVDRLKMLSYLAQLVIAHQEFPRRHLVGGRKDGVRGETKCGLNRISPMFRNFAVPHSRQGFEQLLAKLADTAAPAAIRVGMEATGHYWMALFEATTQAGYAVDVIMPLVIAARCNITIRGTKTDSVDSLLIALVLREAHLKVCAIADDQVQQLRDLTRLRFGGKHHMVALTHAANKMLHVIFTVLKNDRTYTPILT